MYYSARDLITNYNVARTYQEGRYVCFVLKNGIVVKLNPNEREMVDSNKQQDREDH